MHRCVVICFCFIISLAAAFVAHGSEADSLLQTLRARDAQFDNINLHFVRTYKKVVDNSLPTFALRPGSPPYKRVEVDVTSYDQLVVRRDEATLLQALDPNTNKNPALADVQTLISDTVKQSNAKGIQRMYWGLTGPTSLHENTNLMEINSRHIIDTIHEDQMQCEFAHGYGFGKRITNITSVTRTNTGWEVRANMKLWQQDITTATLTIDDDYIVRKALIDARVGSGQNIISCQTEGTQEFGKILLPARGSFEHKTSAVINDNPEAFAEYPTVAAFQVQPTGLETNLTDSQYEELIDFHLPDNTVVFDNIAKTRYYAGNPTETRPLNPEDDPPGMPMPSPTPKPAASKTADPAESVSPPSAPSPAATQQAPNQPKRPYWLLVSVSIAGGAVAVGLVRLEK